jgi:hypothetical protein
MVSGQAVSRWCDLWDRSEAIVGLVACFALTFGPLTIAGLTLIIAALLAEWSVAAVSGVITSVTCPTAVWLARMAGDALAKFRTGGSSLSSLCGDAHPRARVPFAIVLASVLPPLPFVARLPLGIWWLAHFLAGTAMIGFARVLAQQGVIWTGLANGAWAVVLAYAFHAASNVFLVLAVTAIFQSPRVTTGVWRLRFVIDGLFVLPLLLWVV